MSALIMKNRQSKTANFITSPRRSKIRAILKNKQEQANLINPRIKKRASIQEQNWSNDTKNIVKSSGLGQSTQNTSVAKFVEKDIMNLKEIQKSRQKYTTHGAFQSFGNQEIYSQTTNFKKNGKTPITAKQVPVSI